MIHANGTTLHIKDALLCNVSKMNPLSFKDIWCNGYYLETINKDKEEYLNINSYKMGNKTILEKQKAYSSKLYYITIRVVELYARMKWKIMDLKFLLDFGMITLVIWDQQWWGINSDYITNSFLNLYLVMNRYTFTFVYF